MNKKLHFIDLFAGLGGFHQAFSSLGFECVFACELDSSLRELYKNNYGIKPEGDIRKVNEKDIPSHDILCAGFPCQPFSIAGKQKGAKCPSSGKLIDDVVRIAKYHNPKLIFLENVPNILTIDNGNFWSYLNESFSKIGYILEHRIYSPVDFDIPQKRKRVFIVAKKKDNKNQITWPNISEIVLNNHISSYFKKFSLNSNHNKSLEPKKELILNMWQDVINYIPNLTGHYLVASEFGANYPLNLKDYTLEEIKKFNGAWGIPLKNCKSWNEVYDMLPHYIKLETGKPVKWLESSLIKTREIYEKNSKVFNKYIKIFKDVPQSWQKLQWQGYQNNSAKNIWQHLIQFRASGIRIIKPNAAPSLISMTSTQIPILGLEKRYLNSKEAACLQGLHTLKELPKTRSAAFKALGNAVNSSVVKQIAQNVIHSIQPTLKVSGY